MISRLNDVHVVEFDYSGKDWSQWVLLMSDEHYDAIDCDRNLLRRHHEEALSKHAPIFKFGDIFDCMGGKYDPRSHKGDVRPEHNRKDYFDVITKDAADFYSKYPVAFVSDGNHEENVLKRHETDLIGNLAERLGCERGAYSGWIIFRFKNGENSSVRTVKMYYDHGMGGNSPVTKGTIGANRRGVVYDADIMVSGHNHNRWVMEYVREIVDVNGNIRPRTQLHINSGTYLDKPASSRDKFTSGFGQPNKGGVWLYFYKEAKPNGSMEIKYKAIMA